jgi:hypothetical protein
MLDRLEEAEAGGEKKAATDEQMYASGAGIADDNGP